MDHLVIGDMREEYEQLSKDGFRVLALAYKDLEQKPAYSTADESDLILRGYVAFLDPPKDSTAPAIRALHAHGVAVKILTGDNELVSQKICREVKHRHRPCAPGDPDRDLCPTPSCPKRWDGPPCLSGSPRAHKQRIIQALQGRARGRFYGRRHQ